MIDGTLAQMPTTWAEMNRWVHGTSPRTIANNTVALRQPNMIRDTDVFSVYLHGREIAIVCPDVVYVRDCGYVTRTTYDRLKRLVEPFGATVRRKGGVGLLTLSCGHVLAVGDGSWVEVRA